MIKTSTQLREMAVVGAGGRVLGHVEELEIETDGMRLATFQVRVASQAVTDLGIKKPFWSHATLVVHARDVEAVTDVVVLRLTLEELAMRVDAAAARD